MNKKWLNKTLVSALVLAMIGGSGTVLADGKGHAKGKEKQQDKKQQVKIEIKLDFKDLQNYEWAQRHIAALASKRVFVGYDDGTFRPNKPVTRLEAIITAVRLMDLEAEATTAERMKTKLNFKDGDQVAKKFPQAVGYVAVALENDLFLENESKLQAETPADRLWATTLLVKAMKLQAEAKTKMNTKLKFKDAKQIPAGSVGYVAVAIEKGIVFGYNDNTFRPNKPVTRAEMAAFLDRTGQNMPDYDKTAIRGTISAVNGSTLVVVQDGKTLNLTLDPNTFVFKDGVKVSASQLQTGDQVLVRTYNNIIVFVEVTKPGAPSQTQDITGTLAAAVTGDNLIVLTNGTAATYKIDSNTELIVGGVKANAIALQAGDEVTVRVTDNKAQQVKVTKLATSSADFTGTVEVSANATGLRIIKTGQTTATQLAVDANAYIYRGDKKVTTASLQPGDYIFVRTRNNVVVFAQATDNGQVNESFNATVAAAVSNNTIALTRNNQTNVYTLASNMQVNLRGKLANAIALQPGDQAFVQIVAGKVQSVLVTQQANVTTDYTATVSAAAIGNIITLTKAGQSTSNMIAIDANAYVYREGAKATAASLKVGDEVFVRTRGDVVVYAEVTKVAAPVVETVTGLFQSMTANSQGKVTIKIEQTVDGNAKVTEYEVASNVTIIGNVALLIPSQKVELKVQNQVVQSIEIK